MQPAETQSQHPIRAILAAASTTDRTAREPLERRLPDLRVLASIGITLVIVGHSFPNLAAEAVGVSAARQIKTILYVFHMPLFFYMSGFLLQNWIEAHGTGQGRRPLDRLTTRELVVRRFRRILIPYAVISTAVFPIKALLAHHAHNPVDFSLMGLLRSLAFPSENPIDFFWFLPTLFGITILGIALAPLNRDRFLVPIIAVTAGMLALHHQFPNRSDTLFNVAGVLHNLVYFWIGMLHRHFRAWIEPMLERLQNGPASLVLLAAPMAVVLLSSGWALQLAASFAGVLACLLFARAYVAHDLSFLNALEGQSFRIYLLSWFPQVACRILLFESGLLGFWPTAACMFASGLVLPILAGKLADRVAPRFAAAIQI